MPDYYEELCISRAAHPEDVAKAYRMASLKYHPDNNPDLPADKAKEVRHKFTFVAEAYEVLSNAKLRAVFDAYGGQGLTQMGYKFSGDATKVFEAFFGVDSPFHLLGGHSYFTKDGGVARVPVTVPVLELTLPITIEEAYLGTTKTLTYKIVHYDSTGKPSVTRKPQEQSIDVTVPRGIPDKATLSYPGRGHTRDGAAQGGDVLCRVQLLPHATFTWVPNTTTLTYRKSITLSESLSGFQLSLLSPDGRKLDLQVDEIVHPTYTRTLSGEGMCKYDKAGSHCGKQLEKGDLVIHFDIEFPRYLSAEQKSELVRILAISN